MNALRVHGCGAESESISSSVGSLMLDAGLTKLFGRDADMTVSPSESMCVARRWGESSLGDGLRYVGERRRSFDLFILLSQALRKRELESEACRDDRL